MALPENENIQSQQAWDANAKFWDQRMAEGNAFFKILLWPAIEKLLLPVAGQRLLDVACGNGLTSRRMAQAGATVTAFDFSAAMIELAKKRSASDIDYRIIDATSRAALLDLGMEAFDSEIPAALVGRLRRKAV